MSLALISETALLRTYIARTASEMDGMRPLWEELHNQGDATIFQSFAWNRLAAEIFAGRVPPYVVCAESDSGAAIVPATVVGGSTIELLGDALFDYRDVLHAGSPDVLRAAVARLAELRLPMEVSAVRGQRADQWQALNLLPFCNAPLVRRADVSPDRFTAEHARLTRNFRRLAKEGVVLSQYLGDHSSLLEWLYRRKAEQFAGTAQPIFADPLRIDFMLKAGAIDPHAVEIFTFETPGATVAALVTLRDRNIRRFYTIWFDPAWDKNSPGVVLVFAITQRSLAEGLDCDYMTGEQPHKTRLATGMMPLFRISATAAELAAVVGETSVEISPAETELAA